MEIMPGNKRIHAIGAGGIGLSAAVKLLVHDGHQLTASDAESNEATAELAALGVPVAVGPAAGRLPLRTDLVLYSDAVPESDPERQAAAKAGLPLMSYFDFLGQLSRVRRTVAVSGTNGKSTTTAMLGQMLAGAGLDPTVIVGSKVESFADRNLRLGRSDLLVLEACEYRANMLKLAPQTIVLTNLEADHLDFYRDLEHIRQTFQQYLDHLPPDGRAVVNLDDPLLAGMRLPPSVSRVTYGLERPADYWAVNPYVEAGSQSFELVRRGRENLGRFVMKVPGRFNVMNALAALACALEMGAPADSLRRTLAEYRGIWRRFERLGQFNGAEVVSDYGHTPAAVSGTVRAAREFFPGSRIVLCFQPHQRNRTRNLFDQFAEAVAEADQVVLAEIYDVAGREQSADASVSSAALANLVASRAGSDGSGRSAVYAATPQAAETELRRLLRPGDVAIIMGAGNIYKIADRLVSK